MNTGLTTEQINAQNAAEWAALTALPDKKKWWALAAHLMKIVWYDNGGLISREGDMLNHICRTKIAKAASVLFTAHPELLTYDNMELLGAGECSERDELFSGKPGYADLDGALNEYFDGE